MKMKIEDLGYDEFFESSRKNLKLGGFPVARVIVEHKGLYKVKNENGEYMAKITGKQMFSALSREDYPVVGDWVSITDLGEGQAVIHKVLPRKTIIKRKRGGKNEIQVIGTNIDAALAIESVDRDYSLNRFERYFAIASDGRIKPAIILNKIDLISKKELESKTVQIKNRFDNIDFIPTSTMTEEGLNELKSYIKRGKTYCFLGSSGAGKSSLINKLLGKNVIKTEDISSYADRGKHITTNREMYFLDNGGIVIDNPGMREVGMADAKSGIDNFFDEITMLAKKCKYIDCTHIHEPGCAVLSAIKSGKLNEDKYNSYISLKKEAEHYEETDLEKRRKDRQFGKFIKTTKEQLKKYGHKDY
ncbi:MAG: ribosome small subunit-dependent GTPase A [Candidatus Pacebacteria bacterium]|nr:ribosome small subunit-dependent GTPase A [Candidatus Paceibacterota bacterium]MDD4874964.1 ribosome small subunit-dependent GTPase A [Candidatus Paceibacterota bacterium]